MSSFVPLSFVEELIEVKSHRLGEHLEVDLAVNALDDSNFIFALVGYGADAQVFGSLDAVLLAMLLNEITECFAIPARFSLSNARDILQFGNRDGIDGGHSLERSVLEDDVRRNTFLSCHALAQTLEHSQQFEIGSAGAAFALSEVGVEVVVLGDKETGGMIDELSSFGGELDEAVVFDFLVDVT